MRRLMLLRHAKSSWDHMDFDDSERPLAPRGRSAAPLIGRFLSRKGLKAGLVLCSSAVRARETWELVAAEWDHGGKADPPQLDMRSSLYLASPSELLSIIRRIDDDIETAMIVGHNPGMAQLAKQLASQGKAKALRRLEKKFPTAALALIELPADSWSAVTPGQGTLETFVRPKDLT